MRIVLPVLVVVCCSAVAHAQAPTPPPAPASNDEATAEPTTVEDRTAKAKELLDKSNKHFRNGEFREAAEGFQSLLELLGDTGWFLHYNLGLAYENLGVPTKAARHYEKFVAAGEQEAAEDERLAERVQDARERLAALKKRYGSLGGAPIAPAPESPEPSPREPDWSPQPNTEPPDQSDPSEDAFPTWTVVTLGALAVASIALPVALNLHSHGLREEAATLGTDHPDYPAKRDDFNGARTGYYVSFALPIAFAAAAASVAVVYSFDEEAGTESPLAIRTDGRSVFVSGMF